MAKLSFTKLGLAQNKAVKTINYNEQVIEVKQYLPVNDKLELISNVINLSADDNNFVNPVKVSVFTVLQIIETYTNISFTEKQKEDPCKLYDLFTGNELSTTIMRTIPTDELIEVLTGIEDTIASVYTYKNSAMGILSIITEDYSNLHLDADEIKNKIGNPENLALLRDVLTKLG